MSYGRNNSSSSMIRKKSSSTNSSNTWSSSNTSSNPRLRRRRASTGEAFGKKGVVPSSPRRISSSSSSGSPTCVRDFSRSSAATFEEAYQQGTVFPYCFETAAKSLDFSDLAFRSYAAVMGSQPLLQSRQEDVHGGGGGCSTQPLPATEDDEPRRRRRCKSWNDLRIHHDRNSEAIEIECPPHHCSADTNEDTSTAAADDHESFWRSSIRQQHTQHFQCVDEDEEYDYNDYDEGYAPIIRPQLTMVSTPKISRRTQDSRHPPNVANFVTRCIRLVLYISVHTCVFLMPFLRSYSIAFVSVSTTSIPTINLFNYITNSMRISPTHHIYFLFLFRFDSISFLIL